MVNSKHDQFHITKAHFNPPHLYKVVFSTENMQLTNPLPLENLFFLSEYVLCFIIHSLKLKKNDLINGFKRKPFCETPSRFTTFS